MNVDEVVGWAKMFLQDFHAAHVSIAAASHYGCPIVLLAASKSGCFQNNVDASIASTAGLVVVTCGVVIRENSGFVMAACLKRVPASLSIEIAESLTVL